MQEQNDDSFISPASSQSQHYSSPRENFKLERVPWQKIKEWIEWPISKSFWGIEIEKQILNLCEVTRDLKQPKQSKEIMTLETSHFLFKAVLQSYSNFKKMILS